MKTFIGVSENYSERKRKECNCESHILNWNRLRQTLSEKGK